MDRQKKEKDLTELRYFGGHSEARDCRRPSKWCHKRGQIFSQRDCDGDGVADPTCSDNEGNFGFRSSAENCIDSWPKGKCSGIVNKVTLGIQNTWGCGGKGLGVTLINEETGKECVLRDKSSFPKGETLRWIGADLGSCLHMKFDEDLARISYKFKTPNGYWDFGEKFCPRLFNIHVGNAVYTNEMGGSHDSPLDSRRFHATLSFGSLRNKYKKDTHTLSLKPIARVSTENGQPELYQKGVWSPICGHYFWDNQYGADLFCQALQGDSTSYRKHRGKITTQRYTQTLASRGVNIGTCNQNDQSITECTGKKEEKQDACAAGQKLGIKISCSAAVGACKSIKGFDVKKAEDSVSNCSKQGMTCIGECVTNCVNEETGYAIECTKCFGDLSACGLANCKLACLWGRRTQGCKNCAKQHCGDAFIKCSGVSLWD